MVAVEPNEKKATINTKAAAKSIKGRPNLRFRCFTVSSKNVPCCLVNTDEFLLNILGERGLSLSKTVGFDRLNQLRRAFFEKNHR